MCGAADAVRAPTPIATQASAQGKSRRRGYRVFIVAAPSISFRGATVKP